MTRALAHCRWCGTPTATHMDPHRRGRPPTFCTPQHRTAFTRTFGAPRYDGAIQLTEHCTERCALDGTVHPLPGPVRAPGAWADACVVVARHLHGHDVTVRIEPVEHALDPTTWTASLAPLATSPDLETGGAA